MIVTCRAYTVGATGIDTSRGMGFVEIEVSGHEVITGLTLDEGVFTLYTTEVVA